MNRPRVIILRAAGINCEVETRYAWELAGADTKTVHINQLKANPASLKEFQILTLPGGFSYGDDIAAGTILASQLGHFLSDALCELIDRGGAILGICNGFQVLCKSGILPAGNANVHLPRITVTGNQSGRFEDRWVRLTPLAQHCIFLTRQNAYELPVAHGEGRVLASTSDHMDALTQQGCVALKYTPTSGTTAEYPENPNGSMNDVAGVCDPTGRILGLMPHPERYVMSTQHPSWTHHRHQDTPDGLRMFQSAVKYFK